MGGIIPPLGHDSWKVLGAMWVPRSAKNPFKIHWKFDVLNVPVNFAHPTLVQVQPKTYQKNDDSVSLKISENIIKVKKEDNKRSASNKQIHTDNLSKNTHIVNMAKKLNDCSKKNG